MDRDTEREKEGQTDTEREMEVWRIEQHGDTYNSIFFVSVSLCFCLSLSLCPL